MLAFKDREKVLGKSGQVLFSRMRPMQGGGAHSSRHASSSAHRAAWAGRPVSLTFLPGFFRAGRKRCFGERFFRKVGNKFGCVPWALDRRIQYKMVGFRGTPCCVCKAEAMVGAFMVDSLDALFSFFCIEAIALHDVFDAHFQRSMNEHGKHVLSAS